MPEGIHVVLVMNDESAHWTGYRDILADLVDVASVSVAAPAGERLETVKRALGGKLRSVVQDSTELLDRERPQLALITLPAYQAPPVIASALKAGAHVLAEKPSAVTDLDYEPLARSALDRDLLLMLAFAGSQRPIVRDATRIVRRERQLGELYGVLAYSVADQTRVRRKEQQESWFFRRQLGGGGHLIWLGVHFINMLRVITGHEIAEVSAFTNVAGGQPIEVEDSAVLTLRFDNGMLGSFTSAYYIERGKESQISVWGEHGRLRLHPAEGGPLTVASGLPEFGTHPERTIEYREGAAHGYHLLVRDAVRAAAGLGDPPTTTWDGLQALRVVHAAYRSADRGTIEQVLPPGKWSAASSELNPAGPARSQ